MAGAARKARLEEEARNYQLRLEREERERQQQLEQARVDRLLDEAASLRRANDIHAYVDAVNAAVRGDKAKGTKLGRRRVKASVEARILELRANGDGILKIGKTLGVGTSVVQRVVSESR